MNLIIQVIIHHLHQQQEKEDSVNISAAFKSVLGYSEPVCKYYCDVQGMISITLYFPDTCDKSGDTTHM